MLRATNLYGDPAPWVAHDSLIATALSFINCEKYPPSLLYLAMTLGPALLLLAAFERARGRLADWVATFGKVPLFYYVVHLYRAACARGSLRLVARRISSRSSASPTDTGSDWPASMRSGSRW